MAQRAKDERKSRVKKAEKAAITRLLAAFDEYLDSDQEWNHANAVSQRASSRFQAAKIAYWDARGEFAELDVTDE